MTTVVIQDATTTIAGVGRTTYVNALDYGCVGDGTTDNATTLQAAVTAAANKTLYIPAGTYVFSVTPDINAPCTIRGDGMGVTILKPTVTNANACLTIGATGSGANNVTIRDLTLAGNGGTATQVNGWGLTVKAASASGAPTSGDTIQVMDVEINGFGLGGFYAPLAAQATNVRFNGPYLSNLSIHNPGVLSSGTSPFPTGVQQAITIGQGQGTAAFSSVLGYFTPIVHGVHIVSVGTGIYLTGCLNPLVSAVVANGLAVVGAYNDGFVLQACSGAIVSSCIADGFSNTNFLAYEYNDNCRFIGCTSKNAYGRGFSVLTNCSDIDFHACRSEGTVGASTTDFGFYGATSATSARITMSDCEIYNANSSSSLLAIDANQVVNLDIRGGRIYMANPYNPTIRLNSSTAGGMGITIIRNLRMETGAGTNTQTAIALNGTTADIAGNNYTNYSSTPVV